MKTTPLIDGHDDLPGVIREEVGGNALACGLARDSGLDTDIHVLHASLPGTQFCSIWVPGESSAINFGRVQLEQIDIARPIIDAYPDTFRLAQDESRAPVIWSHAAARALVDHPRNVLDEVLARLPQNGGVVMVTFIHSFLSQEIWDMEENLCAANSSLERLSDTRNAWLATTRSTAPSAPRSTNWIEESPFRLPRVFIKAQWGQDARIQRVQRYELRRRFPSAD